MTALLLAVTGFFLAYAIYIAARAARMATRPEDFLDAGLAIPPWGLIFAGSGVAIATLNLHDHLLLTATFGLQYSHVAAGLVLVALTGALFQKRLWLAARITGLTTIGDLMGAYFGSPTIRIWLLVVLFLFSVPFTAYCLAEAGALVETATAGALPSGVVVWGLAFFLFVAGAIGGWRAVIYVVAAQTLLLLALLLFTGAFAAVSFDRLALLAQGIATPEGTLADRIPGVIQFSDGIGKGTAVGGIWTTVAIASFALSLTGIVLSPGFALLGATTRTKSGFAFGQVWMTAALAAGALLLVSPLIAAEIAAGDGGLAGLANRLAGMDGLLGVAFLTMLLASLQIGIAFFAFSGAAVVTSDLVDRYMLPGLSGRGRRLAARIALAGIYLAAALAATFTPLSAAIFAALALPLSVQLLPAWLGLCWVPWISRGAVIAGLVAGTIIVVFTEPFGLIVFERLFLDLPWGRWPLTVHSAAWGLFFNLGACLLVSLFTRKGEERDHRLLLHDAFGADHRADFGGRAARAAKWSLTLIWAFLALGPGAILGNSFFSQPIFAGGEVGLGLPSLLVWQIVFWLVGVLIVWWLAYQGRMSTVGEPPARTVRLDAPPIGFGGRRAPAWIARLLGRLTARTGER